MITPRLYEKLDAEERKLWHSHDFEVSKHLSFVSPRDRIS
jgi:hypothetical protein